MFSIAIIADIHDWHTKKIKFHLEKKGCKVLILKFSELSAKFSDNNYSLFAKNKKLVFDGVWVRFIGNGTLEEITTKLTYLHLLEEKKIYVHNSPLAIEKTVDKTRTTGILEINKIKSPLTFVWQGKKIPDSIFNSKIRFLLKPIFGSQGKNIVLIENTKEIKKKIAQGNIFYLQEFIKNENQKKFSDIRILISNHKIVSCLERSSEKNFITNIYQGAKYEKYKIKSELKTLSQKISKIFNIGYGGIDIKIHKDSFLVLEVNSIPSWKAMQKIEEKNISEILVNDFLKRLKN